MRQSRCSEGCSGVLRGSNLFLCYIRNSAVHDKSQFELFWGWRSCYAKINSFRLTEVPARGVKRHITESAKMWRISLQLLCCSMRGSEGEWDKPAKSPSRSMNCACSTQIAVRQTKPQQSKCFGGDFLISAFCYPRLLILAFILSNERQRSCYFWVPFAVNTFCLIQLPVV